MLIFREIVKRAGVEILREDVQVFPVLRRLWNLVSRKPIYNSYFGTLVDQALSTCFLWNYRYHATRWFHKLRPASASFVARKPA